MSHPFPERRVPGQTHFRQITESARHFAIISMDLNGQITFWNRGASELLGWTPGEMLGRDLHVIYTPEDIAAGTLERELEEALTKGYGSDQRWHVKRNGDRFWSGGEVTPLINDKGEAYGFVKILYDRTSEKQYELQLQTITVQQEQLLAERTRERDRLWRNSLDLLLEIDSTGFLRAINPAWRTTLGYVEADLVDKYFEPFVHPADVDRTLAAIAEASKGPLVHFEVRIKHKDGSYRYIAWTAAPEDGFIYANGRDITTEKRQAELLSAHAEARLRLALEAGQMGVWEWDMRTGRVLLLDGAPALHGFDGSESVVRLAGMDEYVQLIYPDDRRILQAVIQRAIDEGADHRVEYRLGPLDGGIRWIEARGTVLRDEAGKPCFMHGVSVDITRRKRAELDATFLVQASKELAALVDPQTTINKVAALAVPNFADWCAIDLVQNGQLVRLAVAHIDPKKVELAVELHRRYPPKLNDQRGSWQVVRSGRPNFVPYIDENILNAAVPEPEMRDILKELGLTSYIGVPLVAHGEVIGVGTFITAESGRIYTDEDLELAMEFARRAAIAIDNANLYQAVRQADRDKDVFLATLAHELRNPLAALSNAVTLIGLQADDTPRVQAVQQVMGRQIGHLGRLVDDLLDISRITTGKIQLRREPTNLAMILNHAVEASRPMIEAGRHQLSLNYPDNPIEVNGDAARLMQVFSNLLNNAAKFTPEGGRISVDVTSTANECTVRIQDSGIGIGPEMLPQLFRLFAQGRQLGNGSAPGLGIGLSLVKGLVQMHGGLVSAYSEGRGAGSEFIVQLPILPRRVDKPSAQGDTAKISPNNWWRNKPILIVDDNVDAAITLAELLRAFGAEVRTANDGESALRAASDEVPAAVLLDIGMPGMDGLEVARRLQTACPDSGTVLIALTGWGQPNDKEATRAAGFAYHWVKPVTLEQLQEFAG